MNILLDTELTDRHPQPGNLASVPANTYRRQVELPDRQAGGGSEITLMIALLLARWRASRG